MYFNHIVTLLNSSTVLVGGGGEPAPTASAAADAVGAAGAAGGGWFGDFGIQTILMYAALIAALWFFLFRPQRKREKEMKNMQAALKVGDSVLTSSGMFGVITAVGEDCFVVEFGTNKGVRIPIRKTDILGVKAPEMAPPKAAPENEKQ